MASTSPIVLDTVTGPRDNKPAAKCDLQPNLELDKSTIGRGEEMISFGLPHLALREIAAQERIPEDYPQVTALDLLILLARISKRQATSGG